MKRMVLGLLVVSVAACSGEDGAAGMNGTNGVNGASGLDGMNGSAGSNGSNGNDVIISDSAKHGLDISPVAINTTGMTSAQIEAIGQGSYLVNALADCGSCHGEAGTTPGFLAGGKAFSSNKIFARNLTPDATSGMKLSETEFVNAMRTGAYYTCGASCTASTTYTLAVMPWKDYRWSSVSDLKAIYAYLKAIPAVANTVTADDVTGLGGAPVAFGTTYTDGAVVRNLPAETDTNGNPIPDPGFVRRGMAIQVLGQVTSLDATSEAHIGRGSYLINSYGRCKSCHSATSAVGTWMTGGKIFSTVGFGIGMSANLVGANNGFIAEGSDFLTFAGMLQTGTHVDDTPAMGLLPNMPWQHFKDLTDDDLAAMYTYLSSVWAGIGTTVTQLTADPVLQDTSYYCAQTSDCTGANETCDTDPNSNTYHACVGRSCNVDADCKVCQHCSGTGGTCGPFTTQPASCVKL